MSKGNKKTVDEKAKEVFVWIGVGTFFWLLGKLTDKLSNKPETKGK